jgi:alcohol dehydrogenase, propanol-preferring
MLNSIIDTTPAWKPVIESLRNLERGGRLVINAIRKENRDQQVLTEISYEDHLWLEKEIKSVANITTQDVREFLDLTIKAGISPKSLSIPLPMLIKPLWK